MKIQDSDILLVNRGGVDYSIEAIDLRSQVQGTGINDADIMLVNRGDTDYHASGKDVQDYLYPVIPWEEHVANGGVVFHVKDATGTVGFFKKSPVYELDGTYKGELSNFGPGEEVVILAVGAYNFFSSNSTSTWNFGELTDVSNATDFDRLFEDCYAFNGTGLSDWDTSNVTLMRFMFCDCSNFNQDLSQWCVSNVTDSTFFDLRAPSWEAKNKPVWGTCPRGEDK